MWKKLNQIESKLIKQYTTIDLEEEIKSYNVVDYMDKNDNHRILVEVEFEEYILELDDINTKDITLDIIIDSIIRNHMK